RDPLQRLLLQQRPALRRDRDIARCRTLRPVRRPAALRRLARCLRRIPSAFAEDVGGADTGDSARPAHRSVPYPRSHRRYCLGLLPPAGRPDHLSRRRRRRLLARGGWRALRERWGRNAVRRVLEETPGAEDEARADFFVRQLLSLLGRRADPGPAGT